MNSRFVLQPNEAVHIEMLEASGARDGNERERASEREHVDSCWA